MAAIDTFQTAATTFLAAAAAYAADASAVAEVTQGGFKFYFDPAGDDYLGSGISADLTNSLTVFRGQVEDFSVANPEERFVMAPGFNVSIGGGTLVKVEHD